MNTSRMVLAAASVCAFAAFEREAYAQWIYPFSDTLGVTAKGDSFITYGSPPSVSSHTNAFNNSIQPKIAWPAGATGYNTVALEFAWVEPADICAVPEWVLLTVPLAAPLTPTAPITLELRTYWQGADGNVDAGVIATRASGPFIEDVTDGCVSGPGCADADGDGRNDIVAEDTLAPGETVTSLEFWVRWNYARDRLNQGRGPYRGFFIDRAEATNDGQVITLENGGAEIDFAGAVGTGCVPEIWQAPALCFADFGGGNWIAVEFLGAVYDWAQLGFVVDGVLVPSDPVSGLDGCTITQYPAGPVDGVTNFFPATIYDNTGAISPGPVVAAYEVDVSGFPVPVSATNPIRVAIGYQGFSQEQTKEQLLRLFHQPTGSTVAVDVTDEYRSNRKGNLDGGALQSLPRDSASPFILAFSSAVVACDQVSVDAFEPPMGADRKLGSHLPLKLRLVDIGGTHASAATLQAAGLEAPVARVYEGASLIRQVPLVDSGAKWMGELPLTRGVFAAGHTYEVRVGFGTCETVPENATFQVR